MLRLTTPGTLLLLALTLLGCPAETTSSSDAPDLDLRGEATLEGAPDHAGITVRVAIDGGELVGVTVTDSAGGFVVRNVPPRSLRLTFSAEGYDTQADVVALYEGSGFTLNDGQPVTLRPDRSAGVSGVLQSPLPVNLADTARVTLRGVGPEVSLRPEPGGAFEQRDLRPGLYGLEVVAEGHLPASTLVELTRGEITALPAPIVLQPDTSALLEGQVLLEGESEHAGTLVRVELEGRLWQTAYTDAEGWFSVSAARLPHTLTFSRAGYSVVEGPEALEVTWGEVGFMVGDEPLRGRPVVLESAPRASLRGVLRSERLIDDWASRAVVSLLSDDGAVQRLAPVAQGGAFQFSGLPVGDYTLYPSVRGHLDNPQALTLIAGDNDIGAIQMTPSEGGEDAVTLRGTVRLADVGGDVGHAGITVRGRVDGSSVFSVTTQEDGGFAVGVPPDTYELSFSRSGYATSAAIEVFWDEEGARFVYDGAPLEEAVFRLEPSQTGSVTVEATLLSDWIPGEQRGFTVRLTGNAEQRSEALDLYTAPLDPNAELPDPPPPLPTDAVTFANLTQGSYRVTISRPGFATREAVAVVTADAPNPTVRFDGAMGLALTDLRAANLNLAGHVLSSDDLLPLDLSGVNLTGAILRGGRTLAYGPARLGCADLSAADLRSADLSGADLRGALLHLADLTGADLSGVDLRPPEGDCPGRVNDAGRTVLTAASLTAADLSDARFADPDTAQEPRPCPDHGATPDVLLDDARFNLTNLSGAALFGASLPLARLTNANLTATDLRCADLTAADLSAATLADTRLDDATLSRATLTGAFFGGLGDDLASARRADLSRATLTATLIERVDLTEAQLTGARMRDASLIEADLTDAQLVGADLAGASFLGTTLRRTSFRDALLTRASLAGERFDADEQGQPTVDLVGADLTLTDLAGADLRGASFSECAWRPGCDPFDQGRDACRVHVSFPDTGQTACARATLSRTRLTAADLRGANLAWLDMPSVDLSRATIIGAALTAARIDDSDLAGLIGGDVDGGADMRYVLLFNSDLTNARLPRVDLHLADLTGSDLSYARLSNADLSRANFALCALLDANLNRADLTAANFQAATAHRASFEGATFSDTILSEADFTDAVLIGANLSQTSFFNIDLSGADLTDATLSRSNVVLGTSFAHATLVRADLTGLRVSSPASERTSFRGADLSGADLSCAGDACANLEGVDLTLANLIGADLTGATLDDESNLYNGLQLDDTTVCPSGQPWNFREPCLQ